MIDGIEPRSKAAMSDSEKDEIQRQLLDHLTRRNRSAFRGPIALQLALQTSEKNPTHSHHIAKNLLDLFGQPRSTVKTGRRGLLYYDDQQVHALSVTCHHGEAAPRIWITAAPLGSLKQDLNLAVQYERRAENTYADELFENEEHLDEILDSVRDLKRNEDHYRLVYGDDPYEAMLYHWSQRGQEVLLGRAAVSPMDLAYMYGVNAAGAAGLSLGWEHIFSSTPLRIQLSELPQTTGSSSVWKQEIDQKLRNFQTKHDWIVNPLLVPVALEVVIKPPPADRQRGLHDLDNVLRSYLIPRIVDILKPVSHIAFTIPRKWKSPRPTGFGFADPPASTRSGVTRYEAWRLPPARRGENGFVSVAIVSDMTGHGDIFTQLDTLSDDWRENLDSPGRRRLRRRF